ncbi:MAG: ATP-binding cassette domain-containing protein [Kineosporiaceae bacterium]
MHFARLSGLSSGAAREGTVRWLGRFGLADRATSRLDELSHGNQQRVQLAAALVHGPVVAVLDEPFSGLDPLAVETMVECLRELADAGTSILFSSHQLDLVEHICQDVVVIDEGRVVLSGGLEELHARSSRRVLEIRVDGSAWTPPIPAVQLGDDGHPRRRYLVDRRVDLDHVLDAARAAGTVDAFSFEPPSLSDLFRKR